MSAEIEELKAFAREADARGDKETASRAMDRIEALQAQTAPTSILGTIGGAVEPFIQAATGMVAKPVSELAGMAAIPLHAAGLTKTEPADVRRNVSQGLTYQPRTDFGQSSGNPINIGLSAVGTAFGYAGEQARAKLAAVGAPEWAQSGAQEAVTQAIGLGLAKGTSSLAKAKTAKLAQQKLDMAGRNAIKLDAQRLKLITPADRGMKAAVEKSTGADFQISLKNQSTATNVLAKEVGLSKGSISDGAIAARRLALNKPYDAVQVALKHGVSVTKEFADNISSQLDELRARYDFDPQTHAGLKDTIALLERQRIIAAHGQAGTGLIDSKMVMSQIKELRSSANTINRSANQTPSGITEASARIKLSNMYEDLLEQGLKANKQTALLHSFRDARVKLAKIHLLDAARTADGLIDLQKFASVSGRYAKVAKPMTGDFKSVADFTNNFPDVTRRITPETAVKAHPWELAGALTGLTAAAATGNALPALVALPAAGRVIGPFLGTRGMLQTKVPSYKLGVGGNAVRRLGMLSPAIPYLASEEQGAQQ